VTTENPYADLARMKKAIAVEAALRRVGATSEVEVAALDDEGRRRAERAAGVKPCSEATWAVVLGLFREHDFARARHAETQREETPVIIVNPGTGPIEGATETHALANMTCFIADIIEKYGCEYPSLHRRSRLDGGGRYGYMLHFTDVDFEVEMPGLPLERVRYVVGGGKPLWDFPRLYVDGSSWGWPYAVNQCEPVPDPLDDELRQRPGDQPLPVPNDQEDIQTQVIRDIEARRELGISRYGTALQAGNGRDALRDLYEELLDAAMYARQLMCERDVARSENARLHDATLDPARHGATIDLLTDLVHSLPEDHPDRGGVWRAIEVLRTT
jgi:hypothetical protein